MAITVLLEAKAKPGTGNDFLAILKEILPDTRSHDGCKEITVYQNQDDADVVVLIGKWESKEKYEKYLNDAGANDCGGDRPLTREECEEGEPLTENSESFEQTQISGSCPAEY